MRKLFFLLLTFFAFSSYAQEWEVVPYEGKTAEEIQKELRTWIAIHFKSAQNVIQQDDPGKLIAKGGSSVHPKYDDGRVAVHYEWPYRYTLDFEVKDGRFRFDVYDIYIEPVYRGTRSTYTIDEMIASMEEQNQNIEKMKSKSGKRRATAALKSNIQGVKEIRANIQALKEIIKDIPNQQSQSDDW